MFILDTNVVSELMRPAPDPAGVSWVADRATASLFLTASSEAKLRFGLVVMPPRKRREGLARGLRTGFAKRALPFDSTAHAPMRKLPLRCRASSLTLRRPDRGRLRAHAAWRWRRGTFGISRHGDRPHRSVGRRVSGTTEALTPSTSGPIDLQWVSPDQRQDKTINEMPGCAGGPGGQVDAKQTVRKAVEYITDI